MKLDRIFNQYRLVAYRDHLRTLGLSDSSIDRKLSSISTFQKFLVKKKLIEINPSDIKPLLNPPPTNQATITTPTTSGKGFSRYLLLASLLIIISGLGIGLYTQVIQKAVKNLAYSTVTTPTRPGRQLSFQGRLTDSAGNPISSPTQINFKFYDTGATNTGTTLYDSQTSYGGSIGSTIVTPDDNGIFSIIIGKTHGDEIPSSVFSEHAEVWLEITAGGEVMDPRQQIATVAYALNAETIQGLGIGPSGIAYKNNVVILDEQGNLNLGDSGAYVPTIKAINGSLGIEGQGVLIKATDGTGNNITLNPDATGTLDVIFEGTSPAVGGFLNVSDASLVSGNLIQAAINNTNRGYNFINFQNYSVGTSVTTRFSVDAYGNTNVGATLTSTNISIGNTLITSTATELNLLDGVLPTNGSIIIGNGSNLTNLNIGTTNRVLISNGNSPLWADLPGGTVYTATNGLNLNGSAFGLGGTLTQNTSIGTSSFGLSFLGLGNTQSLYIANTGYVGIGTTSPGYVLDVNGTIGLGDGGIVFRNDPDTQIYTASSNQINIKAGNEPQLDITYGGIRVYELARFADGTSALPSISFANDTNSGIYSTAADKLGLVAGGTESMTITAGNVGIGTTAPSTILSIRSTSPVFSLRGTGASDSSSIQFGPSGDANSGALVYNSAIAGMEFRTGGLASSSTRMVIDYLGNVGIGTTGPGYKFDVNGNIGTNYGSIILNPNGGTVGTDGTYGVYWHQSTGTPDSNYGIYRTSGSWTASTYQQLKLSFTTGIIIDGGSAYTRSGTMIQPNGGNVGIGTTAPGNILDVVAAHARARVKDTSDSGIENQLVIGANTDATYGLIIGKNITTAAVLGYHGPDWAHIINSTNAPLVLGTNNAVAMTILGSGNVGIGTTSPLYKLEVVGSALVSSFGIGATDPNYSFHTTASGRFDANLSVGGTTTLAGLSIGSTGAGTTAVFTDASGNLYKNILGAGAFTNGIGTTYAVTNGLSAISTNIFGLGGTLTQNTSIGTSSFGLSFLGLGNTQSLFIANTGYVGIGTTSPGAPLAIESANQYQNFISMKNTYGGGNYNLNLYMDSNGAWIYTGGANTISFGAGSGSTSVAKIVAGSFGIGSNYSPTQMFDVNGKFVVNGTSGNVGIGTSTPLYSLHVNGAGVFTKIGIGSTSATYELNITGDSYFSGNLTVGGTFVSVGSTNLTTNLNADLLDGQHGAYYLNVGDTGDYIQNQFTANQTANLRISGNAMFGGKVGIGTTNNLYLLNVGGTANFTNLFANGNVGIGTTNPTYKLHVVGDGYFSTALTVGTTLVINGTSGTAIDITNTGITTDISLQNGETIDNNTDGRVNFDSTYLAIGGTNFIDSSLKFYGNGAGLREANTNILDTSTWDIGTSGSQTGFSQNGSSIENVIELGTGPYGEEVPLWVSGSQDATSDDEGGWNSNRFSINPEKSYRYTIWMKKTVDNNGTSYFGCGGIVKNLSTGTTNANPYFWSGDLPELDKWYLLVGYIHPWNSSSTTHLGGLYNPVTGQKISSLSDFKFDSSSNTTNYHRVTFWYDTSVDTNKQYMYAPRVDVLDGKEPTTNSLLTTNPNTATNGLSFLDSNSIGLGGTLTQNTSIGTSSFGLSFLGLGNTQSLYIANTGYVGIGTTGPGAKLEIDGTGNTTVLSLMSTTNVLNEYETIRFGTIPGTRTKAEVRAINSNVGNAGGDLAFLTNSGASLNEIVRITTAGNVGIGTTNPSTILDVSADTNGMSSITSQNISVGTSAIGSVVASNGTGNVSIGKLGASTTGYPGYGNASDSYIYASNGGGGNLNIMNAYGTGNIFLFGGGSALSEADLTIRSSGNVGIGTTAPNYKLHVVGNAYVSTSLSVGTSVSIGSNLSVGGTLTLSGTNVGTGTTALFVDSSGIVTKRALGALAFLDSTAGTTYTATNGLSLYSTAFGLGGTLTQNTSIGTSSFGLSFLGLGNTQSLFIASSGKVGIGTTNPTQSLDILGGDINVYDGSTRGYIGAKDSSGNLKIMRMVGNDIGFFTANTDGSTLSTERLTIKNTSGNVGIGTTNPTSNLQIDAVDTSTITSIRNTSSTVARYPNLTIDNYQGSTSGHPYIGFRNAAGTAASPAVLPANATAGTLIYYAYNGTSFVDVARVSAYPETGFGTGGSQAGRLTFMTGDAAGGYTEKMRIDKSGNVGIGTTTPVEKLEVIGGGIRLGTTSDVDNVLDTVAAASAPSGNLYWGNRQLVDTANIANFGVSSITGTANQITVSAGGTGAVTLSTPQNIHTAAAPTFATLDTGQGANELYDMNQNVTTTSSPTFAKLGLGSTHSLYLLNVGGTANFTNLFTSGSVGIGTTNPRVSLEVNGNVVANRYSDTTDFDRYYLDPANTSITTSSSLSLHKTGSIKFNIGFTGVGSSQAYRFEAGASSRIQHTDNGLLFQVAGTGTTTALSNITGWDSTLFLGGSGYIGIGTTSPSATLHLSNTGVGGSRTIVLGISSDASDRPSIQFSESADITNASGMSIEYNGTGTGDSNKLHINSVGDSSVFTIMSGGNVGIGITTPSAKLDVAGNLKIDDNLMIEGIATARVYRNLATYTAGGGSSGAFIIQTNIPSAGTVNSLMSRITVEGYIYDSTSPFQVDIGGYFYTGAGGTDPSLINAGYVNIGSNKLAVRYAVNTGTSKVAIILGDEGTTYSYPKLSVTKLILGHNTPNDTYADSWTITQSTSLAGFSDLTTIADKTAIPASQVTAGTFGAGNYTIGNNLTIGGTLTLSQGASAGKILQSDGSGNASWVTSSGIGGTYTATNGLRLTGTAFGLGGTLTGDTTINLSSSDLSFLGLGNTQSLSLASSGYVGIGTTTPTYQLHVNGSAYATNFVVNNPGSSWLTGKTGTSGINAGTTLSASSYHPLIRQTTSSGHVINLGGLGDDFGFFAYDVGRTTNGYDYSMIMDTTNGNIGINTLSPTYKLHIVGNGHISTSLSVGTSLVVGVGSSGLVKLYNTNNEGGTINLVSNSGHNGYIENNGGTIRFLDTTWGRANFSVSQSGNMTVYANADIGGTLTLDATNTGTGTTALMISSTGIVTKRALGALAFQDSTAGTTYTATNGLKLTGTAFGIGGTLTADTNINLSSSDLSFLGLGNTQSLNLASSGNVGIGVANTSTAKLWISDTYPIAVGSDGVLRIQSLSTSLGHETVSLQTGIDGRTYDYDIDGYGGDSRHLLVLQPYGGYVGIGTTTPSHTLSVVGNVVDDFVKLQNSAANGWTSIAFFGSDNAGKGGFGYGNPSAATMNNTVYFDSVDGVDMAFFTDDNWAGTNIERMRIKDTTGNVGIGTSAPGYKLQVAGSFLATTIGAGATNANYPLYTNGKLGVGSTAYFASSVGIGTSSPNQKLEVAGTLRVTSDVGTTYFDISADSAKGLLKVASGYIEVDPNSTSYGFIVRDAGSGSSNFANLFMSSGVGSTYLQIITHAAATTDGTGLIIKSNGNIGIGTTNPISKLSIGGVGNAGYAIYSTGTLTGIYATGTDYGVYGSGKLGVYGTGTSYGVWGDGDIYDFYAGNLGSKNYFAGNVGIGTSSPTAKLSIGVSNSGTTADYIGNLTEVTQTAAGKTIYGYRSVINYTGGVGHTGAQVNSTQLNVTSGKITSAEGLTSMANLSAGTTVTNLSMIKVFGPIIDGNVPYYYGLNIQAPSDSGTIGDKYSIYTAPGAGKMSIGDTAIFNDKVGIGTATINYQLAVANIGASSSYIQFHTQNTGTSTGDGFLFGYSESAGANFVNREATPMQFSTTNLTRMYISAAGYVGIGYTAPDVALYVSGDIKYTGTISDVSDQRLKENIKPITSALSALLNINGTSFNMIGNTKVEFGFLAQNVQSYIPEAVVTFDQENGYLGVNYMSFIPYLVEAVKEQQALISDLQTDLSLNPDGQVSIDSDIAPSVLTDLGYQLTPTGDNKYSLTDSLGNLVDSINSTFISAKTLVTKLTISDTTITKDLKTTTISPLSELTDTITIDGNASISGTLTASQATIDDLRSNTATVSTLYADNIISAEGSFGDMMTAKVSSLRSEVETIIKNALTNQLATADTGSSQPTTEIQSQAEGWNTDIASNSATINGNLSLTGDMVISSTLSVLGQSSFANTIINGLLSVGQIAIKDNLIDTTADTLYIQPSKTGAIHLMGDTMVIADTGDITINGNLNLNGKLTTQTASVSGDLFASIITATNATISGSLTASNVKADAFYVATDSAQLIIAESGFSAIATSSAQLTSNATAGNTTLPSGKTELIIHTDKLTQNSMVYLTPVGSTNNQVIYLKDKFTSPTPGFTIALDQPLIQDIQVNWWIIN